MAITARRDAIGTTSPIATYGVRTVDARIVWRMISGRNSSVSSWTRPSGPMIALIPETAAWTTQRPSSIARIRDICSCCAEAAVSSYEALFVTTTRNRAPSRIIVRSIAGKLFSKQIGVPNGGRPGTRIACTRSPGASS
jgi:hypothetical protein